MKKIAASIVVGLVLLVGVYQIQSDEIKDIRRKTQIDQATGAKYSIVAVYSIGSKEETDPCRGSYGIVGVIVEFPQKIDAFKRDLLEEGKEYFFSQCGKKTIVDIVDIIDVALFHIPVMTYKDFDEEWVAKKRYLATKNYVNPDHSMWNSAAQARKQKIEETRRQAEQLAQQEIQQQKAEVERQKITNRRNTFVEQNAVKAWPNPDALRTNPFVYQGKTVAVVAQFGEMSSATDGLFKIGTDMDMNIVLVSDIPDGTFTESRWIILAGTVISKKEIQLPLLGKVLVPHLKYVGILNCPDQSCNGLGK